LRRSKREERERERRRRERERQAYSTGPLSLAKPSRHTL
jgi:hypothetical protein